MKAALLISLLASICLLFSTADIPVPPDLDIQRFAGTWYSVAFILKNHEPFDVISIDEVIEPSPEGDLALKIRFIYEGECKTSELRLVHTDVPGVFTIPDTPEIIHMVDVNYDSYHMMHVTMEDTASLYLLSRTRQVSDDVKTKFKNLAKTIGFNVDETKDTRLAESCP